MAEQIVKKSTNLDAAPRRPNLIVRSLAATDRAILWGWRHFVSLKFSIFLLVLIGILSIYGTMNYASNAALGDNAIPMARVLFFEGYWFQGLLLLFAINLIFSTWHVTKMSFGIWWKKEFRRSTMYYEHGRTPRGEVAVAGGLDEAEQALRRRFTRVHRDGNAVFAHKGLLSRMGPTIVHIGILTVIFSQIGKAVLLWNGSITTEGAFIAGEGEPAINFFHEPQAMEQRLTDLNRVEHAIPYWIRVLDFDEIKHPNSEMPAYFSSLLEVTDPATGQITVAQLDMNHSLNIGGFHFHQAGFTPSPPTSGDRMNFDVRDATTGERLAVADADPGARARVGDTDYFLEVDGIQPADRWRLYHMDAPTQVIAEGLLSGGKEIQYQFRLEQFFPDFRIDEATKEPTSVSNQPGNPALKVSVLLNEQKVADKWLFWDQRLAEVTPDSHPKFRLHFRDIRLPSNVDAATVDWNSVAWNEPHTAMFQVGLEDKDKGEIVATELLTIGETSRQYAYSSTVDHGGTAALGTENGYEVRLLGPTQRFATILSVVREPTVPFTMAGVVIMVLGAMVTFMFRYRALYGLWDEHQGTLRLALVPRWGQSVVQPEFDELVGVLSHGKGLVKKAQADGEGPDEVAPEHETVNPKLAEV